MTLKELFTQFGHDDQWRKFATSSTPAFVAVYLRKLGNTDVELLTAFDIGLQLSLSDQPDDRKAKARACMEHLLEWGRAQGLKISASVESDNTPPAQSSDPEKPCTDDSEAKTRRKKSKSEKPELRYVRQCTQRGDMQIPRRKTDTDTLTMEEWQADTRYRTGTIVPESSSKGWKGNKRVIREDYRAIITINGQKYRHRAKTRQECKDWLRAVLSKQILPTDNKADWWRMEQRKDEAARIEEMVASAAEESSMVYEFRKTGDSTALFDYVTKRLLPHMVYYCAHSLSMGKDHSLSASRQAVGLILTRIFGGRPITNITFTCKHMLRIHRNRGDFWYYEQAPADVKLMVNRIDFAPLAEVWKVSKDRKI